MKSCLLSFLLLLAVGPGGQARSDEVLRWHNDRLAAALPMDSALAPVRRQGLLELTLPKSTCRPGERFLEAVVRISDSKPLDGLEWKAELFSTAGTPPVATSTRPVSAGKAALQFDARLVGSGILQISLRRGGETLAVVSEGFQSDPEVPLADHPPAEIRLHRPESGAAASDAWVTFGLPLPAGALRDPTVLRLFDENDQEIPAQFEPTMHWSEEGSLKWLRVDAMVGKGATLVVRPRESGPPRTEPSLVKKTGSSFQVETGAASYTIDPHGALLNRIEASGKPISRFSKTGRGLYVIDQKDRLGSVSAADTVMEIESAGPLVARIKVSGIYRTGGGEELARFTVWLEFAANRPECRITHHFIVTRNTEEVWFKAIGWDWDFEDWQAETGLFAINRSAPEAVETQALDGRTVILAQTSHRRYGGGRDQWVLGAAQDALDLRDGEMGDWAAALTADRGLLAGCRESARQHPKAFRISPTGLGLDLFSSVGGEELDFRAPALVKRWNQGQRLSPALSRTTSELATNAIGWSKTHSLVLSPFRGPAVAEHLTEQGRAFSFPVEACPAPQWTYHTRVLGALYPRDPDRFPVVETFIDQAFDYWAGEQEFFGEYGFVDYFAGPHHTRQFPQSQGRFRASYTLRNAFWLLYLRSAESKFRAMASGSNRTYLDSYLAAWDGPARQRGLYIHSVGDKDPYAGLPFYWEGFTRPGMGTHTNLDQFLLNYLLTGDPRARDGVLHYAEGVKKWWTKNQSDWRIIAVLRAVNRAYALTWDPELRIIQEEILNEIYDPESPVFLTYRDRPYESSTYKTQEDLSALIEGWELHGTRRYFNLATALSRFWWQSMEAGSRFEEGRSGEFLWSLDHNPYYPQRLWLAARHEVLQSPVSSSAEAEFRFQGLPYALAAVAESDTDRKPSARWVGAERLTGQAGVILRKTDRQGPLEATLLFERQGLQNLPEIQSLGKVSKIGQRLLTLKAGFDDGMILSLPPESEPADFFIPMPAEGIHRAFLNRLAPFLLYADGWWRPAPARLNPPVRIFFQLPAGSRDATLHFEKETRLTAPDGSPWPSSQAVRGQVALPDDQPGLWSFVSDGGAVRAEHFPPVFAFEVSEGLAGTALPLPQFPAAPAPLEIEGTPIPAGENLTLASEPGALPFREGTIEFFYKPNWDSLLLGGKTIKRLLNLTTKGGQPWTLLYVVNDDRAGWPGHPWSKSHVLEMEIQSTGPARRSEALCIRRTIFEKDQWVHVALVWGERLFGYTADRTAPSFDVKIFINGKEGKFAAWPRQGNHAAFPPETLTLGPDLDGEVSHLRISSNQRYAQDFAAPAPAQVQKDAATLLFHPLMPTLEEGDRRGKKAAPTQP